MWHFNWGVFWAVLAALGIFGLIEAWEWQDRLKPFMEKLEEIESALRKD